MEKLSKLVAFFANFRKITFSNILTTFAFWLLKRVFNKYLKGKN